MSEWHEIQDKDIEIDEKESEVNFYITYNDFGNIYGILTYKQIEDIYNKIKER